MKNNNLLLIVIISFFFCACNSLNVEPVNRITQDKVFSDAAGVESAIQSMYMQLPIKGFMTSPYAHLNYDSPSTFIGVATLVPAHTHSHTREIDPIIFADWNYRPIRYTNIGINALRNHKNDFIDQLQNYKEWLGNMYFCRAYYYYALVRSYGGVTIVKKPVSYEEVQGKNELLKSRNTEKEVIDFIASDLDSAMTLLGSDRLKAGMADKYVAANLKAKVMLLAAAEAKNGSVELDGLLGIPSGDAIEYYKKAYKAAEFAMDNGDKYQLYDVYEDGTYMGRVKNFQEIFLDKSSKNKERMWIQQYKEGVNKHSWDEDQRPMGFRVSNDPAGELSGTLEFFQKYDTKNGDSGKLNIGPSSNPVRYNRIADLFRNVQPRLRATMLVPDEQFPPASDNPLGTYEIQKGIYESYPDGPVHTATDNKAKWNDMFITGVSGIGDPRTTKTGFIFWKYQNPDATGAYWESHQDWTIMRYAEILLNKAEAAMNLLGKSVDGKTVTMQDALKPINKIRKRAGTTPLHTLTLRDVKKEIRLEFAIENIVYWDLRRWRMLEDAAQNREYHALYPFYVADENKYIFLKHKINMRYKFNKKEYYAPIPSNVIARNSKIKQNPGY